MDTSNNQLIILGLGMDISIWLGLGSLITAIMALIVAITSIYIAVRLQKNQWKRDELEMRRDVLRRLFAYRYRLTESWKGKGQDGEPFIALNEAFIVFASFPQVICAVKKMHNDLEKEDSPKGSLGCNIVKVVHAMADAAEFSTKDLDDSLIKIPFTPPSVKKD